ncbi:hypothetical protein [Rathayibacter festucae]|uniref:hypothetical protein n=1 Tax=Rathayibacter festucae TaxID=110937 RepID=UPI002A6B78DA|nr:hypothetical protein [Rathayibacter festucae]MDY0914487.1 hypothetical protein [Rathayibacter festucae]
MEHSRVALPEPEYLVRIGEIAYTASSMEWTILGDLHRLQSTLPANLTLAELEPWETSRIARKLKDEVPNVTDVGTRDYLTAVYRALFTAGEIRNDVLHARPATTTDGSQRLNRAEMVNRLATGHRFWIDDAWLDAAIIRLNDAIDDVEKTRPPFV